VLALASWLRDTGRPMPWTEPYLESCCRAALHRLLLSEGQGRPPGLKDGPCLQRLAGMGLAEQREDGRYQMTEQGRARHTAEIAGRPRSRPAA
jgi:hypothetical protein